MNFEGSREKYQNPRFLSVGWIGLLSGLTFTLKIYNIKFNIHPWRKLFPHSKPKQNKMLRERQTWKLQFWWTKDKANGIFHNVTSRVNLK